MLLKVPNEEIPLARNVSSISSSHYLIETRCAPVLWVVTHVHSPYSRTGRQFELFLDPRNTEHAAAYEAIGDQDSLEYRFFGDALTHVGTVTMPVKGGDIIRDRLAQARRAVRRYRNGRYNFDAALSQLLRQTSI